MRAIAEFAMRSRWHAIAVSVLAAILPLLGWLSTVIVVLVCLRHGFAAGSLVLLWTLLPIGAAFYYVGDPSPATVLLGAFIMALILRHAMSWELALIAVVALSAVGVFVFEAVGGGLLERFVDYYVAFMAQLDAGPAVAPEDARFLILGFMGLGQAFAMTLLLIIARWCQSALYNPGGFRGEFHALRLSPPLGLALVAMILLCYWFDDQLGRWLPLLTVPLLFASLGLAHWLMADRGLSNGWRVGFYGCLVFLFQLAYPLLVALALMDSWFNIRGRIRMLQKD